MEKFVNNQLSSLDRYIKKTYSNSNSKTSNNFFKNASSKKQIKSTDINVLLNRVKINQKNESIKKFYFSAAISTGLIIFGFLIF